MARTRRKTMTYEERIEETRAKIKNEPIKALREIGKFLVKQIKKDTPRDTKTRTYTFRGRQVKVKPGRLRRSIGYWYRRRQGDLQIGSKSFYAAWLEFGNSQIQKQPFFMKSIEKHREVIQKMIMEALKELRK